MAFRLAPGGGCPSQPRVRVPNWRLHYSSVAPVRTTAIPAAKCSPRQPRAGHLLINPFMFLAEFDLLEIRPVFVAMLNHCAIHWRLRFACQASRCCFAWPHRRTTPHTNKTQMHKQIHTVMSAAARTCGNDDWVRGDAPRSFRQRCCTDNGTRGRFCQRPVGRAVPALNQLSPCHTLFV